MSRPAWGAILTHMVEPMTVAAVQLQSSDDVEANLRRVVFWVETAARKGARLVLLPENFAFFGSERIKPKHAEDLDAGGPIGDCLRQLAQDNGLYLIGGGMPEASDHELRPFNTSVVYGPDGALVARYRKLHLFDVTLPDGRELRESDGTSPGQGVCVVDVEGYQVGLAICYDLRFAELFLELRKRGATLLTLPAAFTDQTGKAHWHVLLRARAIETQCWVMAAAQWGQHPGDRRSYGHSLVVDPWGTVVADGSDREGIIVTTIDHDIVDDVRARIPCAEHRRPF